MKKSAINAVTLSLVFLSLIVSIYFFIRKDGKRVRRTFEFESTSVLSTSAFHSRRNIEARYFLRQGAKESIKLYVDELLLGPITEQSRAIFALGTSAKSIDFSNGTLFIDLSSEALINADAAAAKAHEAVIERTKSGDATASTIDPNAESSKARNRVLVESFEDLSRNIKHNFPRIHNVSCSVEGVDPLVSTSKPAAPSKKAD